VTVLGDGPGVATVFGQTYADVGWRPSKVDTTIPVNSTSRNLPIPSDVLTCLWADVNFDNGDKVTTRQQCVIPVSNQRLVLVFDTPPEAGADVRLDVLPEEINPLGFLQRPVDPVVLSPISPESQVTYSIQAGALPAGILLSKINNTQAEIAGVSDEVGLFCATILATDSAGNRDTTSVEYNILPDINYPLLKSGYDFIGMTNITDITGVILIDLNQYNRGGAATNWVVDESLPKGVSFDNNTGVISLTPRLEQEDDEDARWVFDFLDFRSKITATNASDSSSAPMEINFYWGEGLRFEIDADSCY
jgi:hypothetical protein